MTVTVFSKTPCVQCDSTYRKLDKLGIEYTVVDVMTNLDALEFVSKVLGCLQAPVVLVHEGDWTDFVPSPDNQDGYWPGFRPDRIDALAKQLELVNA